MTKTIDISVVIPIYNNEDSLVELSLQICKVLSSFDFEIIFVNDDSPDESLEVMGRLSRQYSQIRNYSLSENLGQHKATLEGIKNANGNKIVVMDGDLQDSPDMIKVLYDNAFSKTDVVFVKRKGAYQSWGRMMTSTLIKRAVQLISRLHYKAGSFYLFDKSIQQNIIEMGGRCKFPYVSIIVAHAGNDIKYVDSFRSKGIGESGYSFGKRVHAAIMAIYCSIHCRYIKSTLH